MATEPVAYGFSDMHWAGRFDARKQARVLASAYVQRYSSLALRTEHRGLEVILGENASDWGSVGSETKIVFRHKRWELKDKGHVHIKTSPWKRGTAHMQGLDIPWVLLEHAKSYTCFRFGGHTPAHFDDPKQEKANEQILEGLEGAFLPLLNHFLPDVAEGSFDFNRNLGLARNQKLINSAVKSLGMHLEVPNFKTGKVNPIDGFVTTRPHRTLEIVRIPWIEPDYDHGGFVLT